ncbi:HGxxPAAW family protein [Microbacterium sp. YY-03]|uniref:HGxxPAAW family protein n=1 Tax=Microbacterium sp. YY-03 TaxID=3421636 RepID=UPI003D1670D5
MSNPIDDPGHGHSPAAWTAVTIMLVAFGVGTFFFVTHNPTGVYISAGLLVVGLLVGWLMAKLGWGVKGPKYAPKAH